MQPLPGFRRARAPTLDGQGRAREVAFRSEAPIMSAGSLRAEMAQISAAAGSVEQRANALLESLRRVIPYAAAWLAVRDPETRLHRRIGSDGDTEPLARYFALPEADDEVE